MSYGNYPDLRGVSKILVIKMRHHGDVLLTSPLFSVLKKALPEAAIDAYIYEDTLPMLEGHPGIHSFFLYDRKWKKLSFFKKIGKELALLLKLRKEKYDLVINLTEGDRGAIAAKFCQSRYRVGFDPKGKGLFGKKSLYTHLVKDAGKPRHTVEKQLDVLRCIGIFPRPEERDLTLVIGDAPKASVLKKLEAAGITPSKYVVIHPVSRWRFKCPPVSFMADLIKELHAKGETIVLTASPDKEELLMIEEIRRLSEGIPLHDFGGKTTLKELSALIASAKCLITVDSVPLHIASATKTPVVVLFGPTSEINWGPWMHPGARVVAQNLPCRPCFMDGCAGSKMSDCLYTLRVEKVLEAFDAITGAPKTCLQNLLAAFCK